LPGARYAYINNNFQPRRRAMALMKAAVFVDKVAITP